MEEKGEREVGRNKEEEEEKEGEEEEKEWRT